MEVQVQLGRFKTIQSGSVFFNVYCQIGTREDNIAWVQKGWRVSKGYLNPPMISYGKTYEPTCYMSDSILKSIYDGVREQNIEVKDYLNATQTCRMTKNKTEEAILI